MMNKQLTSILLVSGTCIGACMIALPMSLAKIGIIPSVILMFLIWLFTYYTSLVSVELSLQSEKNLTLDLLGRKYSGRNAYLLGNICVKLLSYALLSAYIYGGSSILKNLLNLNINVIYVQVVFTIIIIILLNINNDFISKTNGFLFFIFLFFLFFLIFLLFFNVDYNNLPTYNDNIICNIPSIVNIIFTSFGYQLIFYNLIDHCNRDVKMIKRAYFYGGFIPMVVYASWTFVILSVIYNADIDFYNLIINGKVDVGDLIKKLSNILSFNNLKFIIWIISILTIVTSIIGIGSSLKKEIKISLKDKNIQNYNLISTLMTILPPLFIAALIPNAFIKILNYAGIMSIISAVLLSIYLYFKANIKQPHITILNKNTLILCSLVGILMIISSLL